MLQKAYFNKWKRKYAPSQTIATTSCIYFKLSRTNLDGRSCSFPKGLSASRAVTLILAKTTAMVTLHRTEGMATPSPRNTIEPSGRQPHELIHFGHHVQHLFLILVTQNDFQVFPELDVWGRRFLPQGTERRIKNPALG